MPGRAIRSYVSTRLRCGWTRCSNRLLEARHASNRKGKGACDVVGKSPVAILGAGCSKGARPESQRGAWKRIFKQPFHREDGIFSGSLKILRLVSTRPTDLVGEAHEAVMYLQNCLYWLRSNMGLNSASRFCKTSGYLMIGIHLIVRQYQRIAYSFLKTQNYRYLVNNMFTLLTH